jgi:hypothetical protein
MKIYFAGSIRGGRKDAGLYRKVIAALKEKHQVLYCKRQSIGCM